MHKISIQTHKGYREWDAGKLPYLLDSSVNFGLIST